MKITASQLRQIIREEKDRLLYEAHGLDADDVETLKQHANDQADGTDIKRILNFILTSNVKVDQTQDVTKMKKPAGKK
jgi:hypothetical protein